MKAIYFWNSPGTLACATPHFLEFLLLLFIVLLPNLVGNLYLLTADFPLMNMPRAAVFISQLRIDSDIQSHQTFLMITE